MQCPNCGAEIGDNRFCEYCGTQITAEMQKEQEQLKKQGCPKCGSSNVQFNRENQGEVRGKNSKTIIHRTVGVCKDCGHTWYVGDSRKSTGGSKTWLWVLGWLFIFPVPLTILMLRKKDMKPAIRYGIIAAGWIVYLIIGLNGSSSSNSNSSSSKKDNEQVVAEYSTDVSEVDDKSQTEEVENAIIDDKKNDIASLESDESETEESFSEDTIVMKDYTVKITDWKIIPAGEEGNEYNDVPVIAFWYDVTNTGDNSLTPSTAWIGRFEAVQDNNPNLVNKLDVSTLPDKQFLDSQLAEIKKDGTVANAVAYKLTDEKTPVELTAKESIIGDVIWKHTYNIEK